MRTLILFLSLLIIEAVFPGNLDAAIDTNTLRIGLTRYNSSSLKINSKSGCTITANAEKLLSGKGCFTYELSASEISIKTDFHSPILTSATIRITPNNPGELLSISSSAADENGYRGAIEISSCSGSLIVVNIVDVEDYLIGVLPKEIGESSPQEALRAQAITARTYALANLNKHKSQGFDLCDCTHCQTYAGANCEKPRCSQAVLDTRGMVITYNGQPAEVMYSTDCGGSTVNYKDTRPDFPYLCSVEDPDDIPHIAWEQSYTLTDVEAKLVTAGVKEADGLQNISITKKGLADRPVEITIAGSSTTTITPGKIRSALGLKSTMFSIETNSDGMVVFKGKGAGHGIGLCQTGAKALAGPKYNYTCEQILAHYFPDTQIFNLPAGNPKVIIMQSKIVKVGKVPERPVKEKQKTYPTDKGVFEVRLHDPDRL